MDRTEQRVLTLVGHSAGLDRGALAAGLDLPAATVTSAVARLLRRGDLVEAANPVRRPRAGRRPGLLRVPGPAPLLAVIGWTKAGVRCSFVDFTGAALREHVQPAGQESMERALDDVPAHAADLGGGLVGVVVSVPAPYQRGVGSPAVRRPGPSRPAEVRPTFAARFEDDPAQRWSARLGVPVLFENDANLAAAGEVVAGAARGLSDVVHVLLGESSIGAGLVIGGAVRRGANGFAGELAHVQVDDDGPLCACGGRGCLTGRVGPAVVAALAAVYDEPVTFADLLRLAVDGEPAAQRILTDAGRAIGRPLADLVTLLDPQAVIIGGSLGDAAGLVVDGVREQLDRYASPVAAGSVRVVPALLGAAATVHGAIAVSRDEALAAVR